MIIFICVNMVFLNLLQQKRDSDQENGHLDLRSRPPPRKKDQNQIFQWGCPKFRHVYSEIPQKYTCYCEKIVDPPFDPWIVPHSCGDTCGKLLSCGQHKCLILCHPGPCPPCPKIVQVFFHQNTINFLENNTIF